VSSAVARVGLPERIEAAGAVALLASVFLLDWYGNAIAGLPSGSRAADARRGAGASRPHRPAPARLESAA
jgi:hypothetical protein